MFTLTVAWWELVVRGIAVYAVLLVLIRLSGRRTVGQFTPFDLLVVMLLSEAVSNALSGGEDSVAGAIISAGTLISLNFGVAFMTSRQPKAQSWVEGDPVLIGKDGKLFQGVLKTNRVPEADVRQALREADCDLVEMKCAFLEADGRISILQN